MMPVLPASGYATRAAPTVDPSFAVPDRYQRSQATPDAFGAGVGTALTQMGTALGRAADVAADARIREQELFNKVAADEQINTFESEINKVLYGDPDSPGDTGYLGTQGRAAMDGREGVRKRIDDLLMQRRATLQNEQQRLAFDSTTRRYRNYTLSQVGQHYNNQFKKYTADTYDSGIALQRHNASIAASQDNFESFQDFLGRGLLKIEEKHKTLGSPSDVAELAKREFMQTAAESWADAKAAKDPVAALKFVEQNKEHFGTRYDEVHKSISAKALDAQALEYATGQGKSRPDVKIGGTPSTPITATITGQAYKLGVDPQLALTVAQLESSMGKNLGARGNIFQLGDAEWQQSGGGQKGDPETDVRNGISYLKWTQDNLERRLNRKAEPWEIYMAHQQGVDGATKLLTRPNDNAGQVTNPEFIRSNGGDPDLPAANFTDKWRSKYLKAAAEPKLPPPRETAVSGSGVLRGVGNGRLQNVPGLDQTQQQRALDQFRQEVTGVGPAAPETKIAGPTPESTTLVSQVVEPGDEQVPGLIQKMQEAAARLPPDASVELKLKTLQKVRQIHNMAFVAQRQQENAKAAEQRAKDEKIGNQLLERMAPGSTNPPTPGEIMTNPDLSVPAKENLTRFLLGVSLPGPAPREAANNQAEYVRRIYLPDGHPEKITNEAQLREAVGTKFGYDHYRELQREFREANDSQTAHINKYKNDTIEGLIPRIRRFHGMREQIQLEQSSDPDAFERERRFRLFVDGQVQQYRKEGKNPLTLFDPDSKDYIGSPEKLKPFQGSVTIGQALKRTTGGKLPESPDELRAAVQSGQMTVEEARAYGVQKKWFKADPVVPQ